jgi:hypothetical protein
MANVLSKKQAARLLNVQAAEQREREIRWEIYDMTADLRENQAKLAVFIRSEEDLIPDTQIDAWVATNSANTKAVQAACPHQWEPYVTDNRQPSWQVWWQECRTCGQLNRAGSKMEQVASYVGFFIPSTHIDLIDAATRGMGSDLITVSVPGGTSGCLLTPYSSTEIEAAIVEYGQGKAAAALRTVQGS